MERVKVWLVVKGFAAVDVANDPAAQKSLSVLFSLTPIAAEAH